MNLRSDDKFVEDGGWIKAAERYENFLRTRKNQKVLLLVGCRLQHPCNYQISVLLYFHFRRCLYRKARSIETNRNRPVYRTVSFYQSLPFETGQMTAKNSKATYACINSGEAICPKKIEKQSICIDGDIGEILKNLR